MKPVKVIRRTQDVHGNIIGTYDSNLLLNTMIYDVEFMDGNIREFGANIIAENVYSHVDNSGYHDSILESILTSERILRLLARIICTL